MKVKKRNGNIVDFDKNKITNSVKKAFIEVDGELDNATKAKCHSISAYIANLDKGCITVEEIQDIVEDLLMASRRKDVARKYIRYRYKHELIRESNTTDVTIKELIDGSSDYWNTENSNKNPRVVTTQRDYIAGITSTDIARRLLLPKEIVKAHDDGIIHFHDMDYFSQKSLHNCELCNLDDMLQNGTIINGVKIDKPHRLITATTIATQIITAVTSSSYGGCTITLTHLAPFVKDSYNLYVKKYKDRGLSDELIIKFAQEDLKKEITDSVQTFNYQVNSMTNTNGQAPFLSVCMYLNEDVRYTKEVAMLIEEFFKQRMIGFKNEVGVYVTPAFPKLLYIVDENNATEDSEYWYLTKLAAQCTAKRMVPDYISAKIMRQNKINDNGDGDVYPCMGCRSFLTPYVDPVTKQPKYYGRFNQGVVTINLPDIALSSKKDFDKFWEIYDERLEIAHKALQCRHERLALATSDVAPILWQHGALARLEKGESIHKLLHNNYSTISLGFAGLYETVKYMTGESHSHGKGKEFGLKILQHLNDKCAKWRGQENLSYSVYSSPIETTTYKFAKCLKKRFGIIEGITDKDYITNSYHINVREEIDPFEKLKIESEYQKLSPGGRTQNLVQPPKIA